ncbi:MAG: hypothetical protein J5J06_00700 [Phycisphaerae bacterium]|nr:hypothetical protein [Phycisphaerae bacterium]
MSERKETVLTLNVTPGASGTRIDREKYDRVREAILAVVPRSRDGVAFKSLPKLVAGQVPKALFPAKGSASWYTTVVKLDLEARGLIERIPGKTPQHLRRKSPSRSKKSA